MEDKQVTSGGEWATLIVIIIITIAAILVIFLVLRPRLTSGAEEVGTPLDGKGCIGTAAPLNISASIPVPDVPTIDIVWDPRTTTTVPGEIVLGYRVYVSSDSQPAGGVYTPVRSLRVTNLIPDTTYFIRVSTVDTCGEGPLSSTPTQITIPPAPTT